MNEIQLIWAFRNFIYYYLNYKNLLVLYHKSIINATNFKYIFLLLSKVRNSLKNKQKSEKIFTNRQKSGIIWTLSRKREEKVMNGLSIYLYQKIVVITFMAFLCLFVEQSSDTLFFFYKKMKERSRNAEELFFYIRKCYIRTSRQVM